MMDSSYIAGALLKNALYFYTLLFTHPTIQIIQKPDALYVTLSMCDETYDNVWKTDFKAKCFPMFSGIVRFV